MGNTISKQDYVYYGNVQLPAGTKLSEERLAYVDGSVSYTHGDGRPMQFKTCRAELPNGVKIDLEKNDYVKNQKVEIDDAGNTIFTNLSYRRIQGTDGDDSFIFKSNFNELYNPGYIREVDMKDGNDKVSGQIGEWDSHGRTTTRIKNEGNLSVFGKVYMTTFESYGTLDLTKVQKSTVTRASGIIDIKR